MARMAQGCRNMESPNFTETGIFTASAAGRRYLVRVPGVAQSRLSDEDLQRC